METKRKNDGLLDGLEDEDSAAALPVALVAGVLVCLAALVLGLA
jgi:hypothetical protein